jgi:hypothetical protein
MKKKAILFSILTLTLVGFGYAQDVEHDDMYFTSKDRAKLRAAQQADQLAYASVSRRDNREDEDLNPTDTYSARNVNPEYTSRRNSQTAQADNGDYFVNNYQFNRGSNYNNFNNSFSNWYGSSWYRPNYWGSSINSWNSPYYGYYDSWNSPWYDPYWSYNGYSTGFSYYAGSNYNYGWGGMYNYWNRPYYAGNNYFGYGSSFGYGSNWYWNNYRPTVVINNSGGNVENGRGVAYGRRPSRGSYYASPSNDTRTRTTISSNTRGDNSGGRTRTEYYNNTWRYNNYGNSNSSNHTNNYDSRSQTQYNRSNSWNNSNSNSSWGNSGSRSNTGGFDGGSRTHSAPAMSGGGGGGGGRSRRD